MTTCKSLKQLPSFNVTKPKFFISRTDLTHPATVTVFPAKASASA